MISRAGRILLLLAMQAALAGPATGSDAAAAEGADSCEPETVAIDTSRAERHTYRGLLFGTAAGETFVARDTLVRSVAMWIGNGGGANTVWPVRLWITRVDSAGVPITHDVVFRSPVLRPLPAESRFLWRKAQYGFDPPLRLPHRGMYALFIQEPCILAPWVPFNESDDVYPEGQGWFTGRPSGASGCALGEPYNFLGPRMDVIFEVVFCHQDVTTPVQRTTWGKLKIIYR